MGQEIRRHPEVADHYVHIGLEYLQRRSYQQAIEHLRKALSLQSDCRGARLGLILGYIQSGNDAGAIEELRSALEMAIKRGTILHVVVEKDEAPEEIYFLNTVADSQIVAKIRNGEFSLPGLKSGRQAYIEAEEQPDIFTLYEQNIGMLTPMIAEELMEAEKHYPEIWIRDAIKEAVTQNKRKWNYISAILERWSAEGKSDGTYRRDSKTGPDKYIKQRYGHMVKR